jgi:hypothetical protein
MKKRRLIYILSPSYSGSTLLTILMAQHNNVATIGELKATAMGDISKYVCSCGALINECEFWKKLKSNIASSGGELDLADYGTHFLDDNYLTGKVLHAQVRGKVFETIRDLFIRFVPRINRTFHRIIEKNRLMVEEICKLQECDLFLDDSKDPNRLIYFIESGLWDVNVIRMHRDGRAQCNSFKRRSPEGVGYKESAVEWKKTIKQMDRACSYLSAEKVHTIRYEDLCADPNKAMEAIWGFLQIENANIDWKQVDLKKFSHHILGNNMRLKETIYISLDEKWKSAVTQDELMEFEQICGQINRELGYS